MKEKFEIINGILAGYNSDQGGLPVFHPRHHPCSNTAGDILFELSESLYEALESVYLRYKSCGDIISGSIYDADGELDFLRYTDENRQNHGLPQHLYVVQVTEVEEMDRQQIRDFVYSEVSAAVAYLNEYLCPPWDQEEEDDEGVIVRGRE